MPIYEFKCGECGEVFEEFFRGVAEKRKPRCAKCGSKKTRRILSVFAMSGGRREPSSGGASSCGTCTRRSCAGCR